MRLAVLDAGSNTVRLLIADAAAGVPLPVHTLKVRLRLAERLGPRGRLDDDSVKALVQAIGEARDAAREWGAKELFAYATSVVRDAPNRMQVIEAVRAGTGLSLALLPGETEAELTFLAARRWMGSRAGAMALLDIGGGSLEVAFGRGGTPDFAVSLPLGAGRLTRERLGRKEPPERKAVQALRRHVRGELKEVAARIRWEQPRTSVATSRTFHQLARLCGAPPDRSGPFAPRSLRRRDLQDAVRLLAGMTAVERSGLPGISAPRARQSLAGAVVAHTAMKLMGMDQVVVCPWALREGVLLRHLEGADPAWWERLALYAAEDRVPRQCAAPGPPADPTHGAATTEQPGGARVHLASTA